ncbi:hypothetical protein NPIL_511231 [Nephila pilipes]|uniref:Tubuliform egg casing silk strands structural domain-containing protein n=1 Tax=Nephila pilipes TaxID=299642 RepID=A0A8X6MNX4_NEPPI|nr:hypothetical protein NPIL_511231 [Nephila pilipes]
MHLVVFLIILHVSVDISAAVTDEKIPSKSVESKVNAFTDDFYKAVRSSNVLTQLFDWHEMAIDQLSSAVDRKSKSKLSSWGIDNAENLAASITQYLTPDFPALSSETVMRIYGFMMANYLVSEGILNDTNGPSLALAYARSLENFANSGDTKYEAVSNGFVNFVISLTPMTPERGIKLVQKFEEAMRLENARQGAPNPSENTDESAVNAFGAAFSEAVRSSNILTQLFDWREEPEKEIAQTVNREVKCFLSAWSTDNVENIAASTTQYIPQNFSAYPLETPIRAYSNSMANYLVSEGILNTRNAPSLAKAYAKSFEHFASRTEIKISAVKDGFLNFTTSLTPMTPERGLKLAQKFEEAWRLATS